MPPVPLRKQASAAAKDRKFVSATAKNYAFRSALRQRARSFGVLAQHRQRRIDELADLGIFDLPRGLLEKAYRRRVIVGHRLHVRVIERGPLELLQASDPDQPIRIGIGAYGNVPLLRERIERVLVRGVLLDHAVGECLDGRTQGARLRRLARLYLPRIRLRRLLQEGRAGIGRTGGARGDSADDQCKRARANRAREGALTRAAPRSEALHSAQCGVATPRSSVSVVLSSHCAMLLSATKPTSRLSRLTTGRRLTPRSAMFLATSRTS